MSLEKHIKLSQEAEGVLLKIQKEKGFSSINRTLEFIITDYENNCNVAETVSKKVTEDLSKVLTRIRLGTNTADVNSQIIIELLNAIVYQFNVAPMTTQMDETTAVKISRQSIKDKIAGFKQRKDNKAGR